MPQPLSRILITTLPSGYNRACRMISPIASGYACTMAVGDRLGHGGADVRQLVHRGIQLRHKAATAARAKPSLAERLGNDNFISLFGFIG